MGWYHPGEGNARAALRDAIAAGTFPRPSACVACGVEQGKVERPRALRAPVVDRVIWHHWNGYATIEAAFQVVALCRSCHQKVHWGSIVDPGTGQKRVRESAAVHRSGLVWESRRTATLRHRALRIAS